jgi:hypothetical protein
MFKSKEDLIKECEEESLLADCLGGNKSDIQIAIDSAFASIHERIEFYRTYRYNPILLHKEKPDIYFQFCKDTWDYVKTKKDMPKPEVVGERSYTDNWLFHFCFDGVK